MANGNASLAAARVASQQALVKNNQLDGNVKCFVSTFTNPAAGGVGIGEYISWGFLPQGARLLPGAKIYFSAGAASSTINLGDPASAARYLAATSVAAAGNATAEAQFANGALTEVDVVAPGQATDKSELRSTVAGAALGANQVLTLVAQYVSNN